MWREILCLCLLILMMETSIAQELDDKIPLLDEPIMIPKEEISTEPEATKLTELPEANEIIQSTSSGTITIESSAEESEKDTTPIQTSSIKEEPEMGQKPEEETTTFERSPEEYTKSTETSPLGTLSTESLIGTTTSVEKAEEGTETPHLGTLTTESLVGTTSVGTTTVEIGTTTLLNTGLILVPTAYRRDDKLGFNTDFIIAYYIGEIWHEIKGKKGEFFEPIKFLFLSGDFKFSMLKEKKQFPHLGAGYEWFLVLQGAAATPAQMGGEFSGKSDRFGYPYIILSKKFKYLKGHLGMMSGQLGKLVNPLSEFASLNSQKAIIFGLETKLFNREIKIEGISSTGDEFHLLINTSIERFLGFDLSFMKIPQGYSIIGYFGIRMNIFPHIKDKK